MSTLAIIPARKGSKRLPGKNMKLLNGQPLIYYSIIQARFAKMIDEFVVSTDSPDVKKYCVKMAVPYIERPNELATDDARMEDVVLSVLKNKYFKANKIVLLQPTSPLRGVDDINNCVTASKHGSVVSVSEFCSMMMYKKNGAVYVWDTNKLIDDNFSFDLCYVMPPERSVDIDTQEDFDEAERLINAKNRI
jgi:CMP-N-acetylneuraminic acid synthetase